MKNLWSTNEWKLKRTTFLKGKKCSMCGTTDNLVIHHPQKKNKLTNEQYLSFKGVKVSCKRCHWAIHKRYELCPRCKTNYKRKKYDICFKCQYPKEGKD